MPDIIADRRITQEEAGRLMAPMELDLLSAFKVIQEDILTGLENYEGTPEQYIEEVLKNLSGVGEMGEMAVLKSMCDDLRSLIEKGKPLPSGTRRQRSDGVYVKQSDGTWIKETEKKVQENNDVQNITEKDYNKFIKEFSEFDKSLSENERETIKNYTFSSSKFNKTLKEGEDNQFSLQLKKIFEKSPGLNKRISLQRGMRLHKDVMNKLKKDSIIHGKAFTSLTSKESVVKTFSSTADPNMKEIKMKVNIPKGTKLLNMNNEKEQEFLLNAGTDFKIKNIKEKKEYDSFLKKEHVFYEMEVEVG